MKWWDTPKSNCPIWTYDGPAYTFWGRFIGNVQYETTALTHSEAVRNINYRLKLDYDREKGDHVDPFKVVQKP